MPKLGKSLTMKCSVMVGLVCCVLCVHVVKITTETSTKLFCIYVLYAEHGSERFQKFVELLGDEVGLEGWQQFRGGLDNKSKLTKHHLSVQ